MAVGMRLPPINRQSPNFAKAPNNLGHALKSKGRLVEAVTLYRCALRLKPEYAEANSSLGSALPELFTKIDIVRGDMLPKRVTSLLQGRTIVRIGK